MKIQNETTLREVANAGEAARAVLARAGLDYCCNGHRSLADACNRANVALATLEAQLRDVEHAPSWDWSHRGITPLLDYLLGVAYPRTTRLLDELAEAAARLDARERHVEVFRGTVDVLVSQTSLQMSEEEQVIFARVRALADARKGRGPFPSAFRTMHDHGERLREGHVRTHDLLRRVDAATTRLVDPREEIRPRVDAATTALTEQMHLENNELMPRALELEPNYVYAYGAPR